MSQGTASQVYGARSAALWWKASNRTHSELLTRAGRATRGTTGVTRGCRGWACGRYGGFASAEAVARRSKSGAVFPIHSHAPAQLSSVCDYAPSIATRMLVG